MLARRSRADDKIVYSFEANAPKAAAPVEPVS
jgi:hypothetical protein